MSDELPNGFRELFGHADTLHMPWGTRYKYNRGYWIDAVDETELFHVCRAGRPSQRIDKADSLEGAQLLMMLHWEERGHKDV